MYISIWMDDFKKGYNNCHYFKLAFPRNFNLFPKDKKSKFKTQKRQFGKPL